MWFPLASLCRMKANAEGLAVRMTSAIWSMMTATVVNLVSSELHCWGSVRSGLSRNRAPLGRQDSLNSVRAVKQ